MVRLSANEQDHWLSGLERCLETSFSLINADFDAPTTPVNAEGHTVPTRSEGRPVQICQSDQFKLYAIPSARLYKIDQLDPHSRLVSWVAQR